MSMPSLSRVSLTLVATAMLATHLAAQESAKSGDANSILAQETYIRPPAEIERLVLAPRHLNVTLANQSPTRRHFVKMHSDGMPSVQDFGKTWDTLAGFQVDPKANRLRPLTTRAGTGLEIIDATTGKSTAIDVPAGAHVSGPRWSPDGAQLAFLANFDAASHVYVADIATGKSRRVTTAPVLATFVAEPEWAGNDRIVVVLIPENRGVEPRAPVIATGPKVRLTKPGAHNRTRTYADLLEWPYERDLLEYFTTGQLATVDVRSRAVRKIGAPAMIRTVDASPSGNWFHVTVMEKPFSYVTQVSSFGGIDQIWDAAGKPVVTLGRRVLRDETGDDDDDATTRAQADSSKRNVEWLASSDGIYFLQGDAAQSGAAAAAAEEPGAQRPRTRDRLYLWSAPFDSASRKAVLENSSRMSEVAFSADGKTAFVAVVSRRPSASRAASVVAVVAAAAAAARIQPRSIRIRARW